MGAPSVCDAFLSERQKEAAACGDQARESRYASHNIEHELEEILSGLSGTTHGNHDRSL
jgi:hypothetical protein